MTARYYRSLQRSLLGWGLIGLLGIPIAVYLDLLNGWRWGQESPIYDQMIVSIYFVLGIFLLRAAKKPEENVSLIEFTIWSSYAHGLVMLFHAIQSPEHRGHLLGDVWILFGGLSLQVPLRLWKKSLAR